MSNAYKQMKISSIANKLSGDNKLKVESYKFSSDEQSDFNKEHNDLIKKIEKLIAEFNSVAKNTNNGLKDKALNLLTKWCNLIDAIYTADKGWFSTEAGSKYKTLGTDIKTNLIKTVSNGSSKDIIEKASSFKKELQLLLKAEGEKDLYLSTCLKVIHLNLLDEILEFIINMAQKDESPHPAMQNLRSYDARKETELLITADPGIFMESLDTIKKTFPNVTELKLNDYQFKVVKSSNKIMKCLQTKGIKRLSVSQNEFNLIKSSMDEKAIEKILRNVYGVQVVRT